MGKLKRKKVISESFFGMKRYGRVLRQGLGSSGLGWEEEGDMPVKILGKGKTASETFFRRVWFPFLILTLTSFLVLCSPPPLLPSPIHPLLSFSFSYPSLCFYYSKKKKIWGGRGRERGKGGIDQNIPFGRRENKRIYGVVSRVLYTPGERRGTKRKNEDGMGWDGVGIGSSCVKGDSSVL